ncbi:phage tail protein [Pseudomonas sp. P8_241]|uniref:phage tail-collar fiber domain-containing protein n=1 Tax=Pseudomonas sp. P8_241 TaxID=3043445 RepID=UPI002A35C937|nr:phage tail protein [Pseudomonas sp. P8_241]WPN45090.1 phage tail protein [Pseudomonas sp. P8_241]
MIDKTSQFFAILTAVGEAKHANAIAMGLDWMFTEMGLGDANGTDPIPDRLQTQLIHEWRRAPINQIRVDPANPNTVITEQIIPPEVGGEWIREIGLYDVDGDLVAVANCAPSYKPLLDQGSGKTQVVRMNFIVSSSANIVLKIDPAVVLATREYVDLAISEALAKLDHKQSARVAATAAIALSNVQTIDDVAVVVGDRVLVTAQEEAQDNGVYVVSAEGWERAADADNSLEVTPGLFIQVEQGTVNGDSLWQLVTDAPVTLGTTGLQFELIAGGSGAGVDTFRSVTVDALGRVIAGTNPTTLDGYGITDALPVDGTAVAATQLETERTLRITGAATGSASFDGTDDADIAITLVDSGVVAGTYSSVTVDEKGLVTAGDQLTGDDLGLGTAAYKNAQISSDDVTAQALMMVGAFGVGGPALSLPNGNIDLLSLISALYYVSAGTGGPQDEYYGWIRVSAGAPGEYAFQEAFTVGGPRYERSMNAGVWEPWVTVWDSENFNPVSYQPALGFTPVQQGGGTGQGNSKIFIGWSDTGLKVTVDTTDLGGLALLKAPAFVNGITVSGDGTFWNNIIAQANITGHTGLYSGVGVSTGYGTATFDALGNSYGPTWGGWLSTYLAANFPTFWSLMSTLGSQPVGGVGTYGLFRVGGNGLTAPGTLVAAVNLLFSDCQATSNHGNPAGTWMLMGGVNDSDASTGDSVTLCMRVA